MLMILTMLTAPMLTTLISPVKRLWEITIVQSLSIASISTFWLYIQAYSKISNQYLVIDEISMPLLILTYWLTAPVLLASQNKLSKEPTSRQRVFIFTILLLQTTTILAFLTDNMMMFFIMFESTVIPTLIVITRWGVQKERLLAGTYFLFYTIFGSMALLTILLTMKDATGTLSIMLMKETQMKLNLPHMWAWWSTCFIAFFIKMPLYGLHLWLPKAHVEAPIAGSMILAGTLLKLGGYGIIRVSVFMNDLVLSYSSPLIIYSLLGVILSAITCSRQTDLKSLIAFSSISHMGLVIAASMINTESSIMGAMILMVSHGLTSSALFCLANTSYERTHTRTLTLLQGSQIIFPLMATWWLLMILMNMALPPSPNFIGEFMILSSLFHWSSLTTIMTGLGVIFTTFYSLFMFWTSQREHLTPHAKNLQPTQTREHIVIALHILPAILLTLNPNFLF